MVRISKDWPKDLTMQLIEEYRKRPEMWNTNNKLYNNRRKQNANMFDLMLLLNKNKRDIQNKIRGLRTTYFREFGLTFRKGNENYKTKWEYYNALNFINSQHLKEERISPFLEVVDIPQDTEDSICSSLSNRSIKLNHNTTAIVTPSVKRRRITSCEPDEDYVQERLIKQEIYDVSDESLPLTCVTGDVNNEPAPCTTIVKQSTTPVNNSALVDSCQHFGNFIASEMREMATDKRNAFKNHVLRSLMNYNGC